MTKQEAIAKKESLQKEISESEFSMKYHEIQSLIKNQVEKRFKIKGITPTTNF
jgi:hypothetical protein